MNSFKFTPTKGLWWIRYWDVPWLVNVETVTPNGDIKYHQCCEVTNDGKIKPHCTGWSNTSGNETYGNVKNIRDMRPATSEEIAMFKIKFPESNIIPFEPQINNAYELF